MTEHFNFRHGHRRVGSHGSPEYLAWQGMIWRCYCPTNGAFPNYGAKGVRVAREWRGRGGFERFFAHVGPKPSLRHSLDRIDNAKGYRPGNVRWATQTEQQRNRTIVRTLTIGGVTKSVAEWAAERGVEYATAMRRLYAGWSTARIFEQPTRPSPRRGQRRAA